MAADDAADELVCPLCGWFDEQAATPPITAVAATPVNTVFKIDCLMAVTLCGRAKCGLSESYVPAVWPVSAAREPDPSMLSWPSARCPGRPLEAVLRPGPALRAHRAR
ncbi:uncharacterized protein RMCB_6419 [Mycolicibacterium brisbanense]|uniref:Uncharacterized protein n=1 Tax=Mycolicibacterium brisbanense TaxID=146020 RepID=A0A100W648_9MYCO|nr:uncharacterized protein RMCB_6419 [Mycolicibacterium brisbanense]